MFLNPQVSLIVGNMLKPAPILLYKLMSARFGFLNWWPGDSPDEILIGAVLTQNTSWKNVEKAISTLKEAKLLSVKKLAKFNLRELQQMIKPSGYYRQKAKTLTKICTYITSNYETTDNFFSQELYSLRKELLSLNGIGPETADAIILYAAEKPVFVIDSYTRRIMQRVYAMDKEPKYEALQEVLQKAIPQKLSIYKDFHAQFVELGKNHCRKKPLCDNCPLNGVCKHAASIRSA